MNLLNSNSALQVFLHSDFWNEILKSAISGLFTFISIGLAAYLTYRFALGQRKKEIFTDLEKLKYERKMNALEACWKLCIYMTDTENEKVILLWTKDKGKDKQYFIKKSNAESFLKALPEVFYRSGIGLYLDNNDIKEKLFQYRSIIYGFLSKEKNNDNDKIQVHDVEFANKLIDLFHNLIEDLRNEINQIDKIKIKK